jgi:hypothetical protein
MRRDESSDALTEVAIQQPAGAREMLAQQDRRRCNNQPAQERLGTMSETVARQERGGTMREGRGGTARGGTARGGTTKGKAA